MPRERKFRGRGSIFRRRDHPIKGKKKGGPGTHIILAETGWDDRERSSRKFMGGGVNSMKERKVGGRKGRKIQGQPEGGVV